MEDLAENVQAQESVQAEPDAPATFDISITKSVRIGKHADKTMLIMGIIAGLFTLLTLTAYFYTSLLGIEIIGMVVEDNLAAGFVLVSTAISFLRSSLCLACITAACIKPLSSVATKVIFLPYGILGIILSILSSLKVLPGIFEYIWIFTSLIFYVLCIAIPLFKYFLKKGTLKTKGDIAFLVLGCIFGAPVAALLSLGFIEKSKTRGVNVASRILFLIGITLSIFAFIGLTRFILDFVAEEGRFSFWGMMWSLTIFKDAGLSAIFFLYAVCSILAVVLSIIGGEERYSTKRFFGWVLR